MSFRMSKRWVWAILLITVVVTLTVPSVIKAKPVEVWVHYLVDQKGMEAILPEFLAANKDLDVNMQLIQGSHTEYMEKLRVAIVAGAPPDIAWVSGGEVKEWAYKGQLLEVTNALRGLRFNPGDTAEATLNGKLWASPYRTVIRGLFKNADLFEQVGLNPDADPESPTELERWSMKFDKQTPEGKFERVGFIPWQGNWHPPGWMWSFGGRLVDDTGIVPTANEPANVRAFEWLAQWGRRYGNNPNPVNPNEWNGFLNSKMAMMAQANTMIPQLQKASIRVTIGEVPHAPEGHNGTWGGGDAYAIPFNSANADGALRLLRYMASPKPQELCFKASLQATVGQMQEVGLPANLDAIAKVVHLLPPVYSPLLAQVEELNSRTPLWLDYMQGQLRPALDSVVRGQKTPRQALDDVQRFMEARFRETFKK